MKHFVIISALALTACASTQTEVSTAASSAPTTAAPAQAGQLSVNSTIAEIAAVPRGREILEQLYPGLADGAVTQGLRFTTIANSMNLGEARLAEIDAELRALPH